MVVIQSKLTALVAARLSDGFFLNPLIELLLSVAATPPFNAFSPCSGPAPLAVPLEGAIVPAGKFATAESPGALNNGQEGARSNQRRVLDLDYTGMSSRPCAKCVCAS